MACCSSWGRLLMSMMALLYVWEARKEIGANPLLHKGMVPASNQKQDPVGLV